MPSRDDYANDVRTTSWIDVGSPVTGEIETGDDADWFAIWLEEGTEYTFDLEGDPTGRGTLTDPMLYLLDGDGEVIDVDDDGGESYNSRIVFTPEDSGTYYLSAESWGEHTGTYTLTASGIVDDYPADPDTTNWIEPGSSATGEIETGDDADWFAIWLEEGTEYTFDLEGNFFTGQGALPDPLLYLLDGNGEVIDMDDDSGEGLNSHLAFTPDESAVYYLSAESWGEHTGTYTLTASGIVDDYPADPDTTNWIEPGSSATGEIETGDDADWFAIWLEEGTEYTFDLEGAPTEGGTLADPMLYLLDGDGDVIDMDDDGGVDYNSRIVFTPDESAVYYLSAESWGEHTGTYTLTASGIVDDYPADPDTTNWIEPGSSATGEIETGDDADWFAIWLEDGTEYTFDLEGDPTGQGTLPDPMLFLLDGNGEVIDMDDDGGEGLNSHLVFTPDEAGVYYLSAESWGDHVGTYTLSAVANTDIPLDLAM